MNSHRIEKVLEGIFLRFERSSSQIKYAVALKIGPISFAPAVSLWH